MPRIPLTRGMTAVVDAADYALVSGMKWYAYPDRNYFYAGSRAKDGSRIRMHRLIMDAKKGEIVDHRDEDGLNNRRKNLRKVTNSHNLHNCRRTAKGCSWDERTKRWKARIMVNRKEVWLGRFPTAALARAAWINAKKEHGFI